MIHESDGTLPSTLRLQLLALKLSASLRDPLKLPLRKLELYVDLLEDVDVADCCPERFHRPATSSTNAPILRFRRPRNLRGASGSQAWITGLTVENWGGGTATSADAGLSRPSYWRGVVVSIAG